MNKTDEYLKNKILNLSDTDLIKMAYLESIDYRDEVVQFAISEVRRRGLKELNIKHCPHCRKPCDRNISICQCGYNFEKPNLDAIERVKKKRRRKNRLAGLSMLLIGGFFLFLQLPAPGEPMRTNATSKFTLGIPAFLMLIGLYKLLSAAVVRKPTKSPFDGILGDSNKEKGEKDDIEFFFCPSCSEQLFTEMKYKACPNCGKILTR
jgi:hypothetical protein